jgi:hypothetical protein
MLADGLVLSPSACNGPHGPELHALLGYLLDNYDKAYEMVREVTKKE